MCSSAEENTVSSVPGICTRRGDGGRTLTAGKQRVDKTDVCVEACGALDELNAHVGLLVAWLRAAAPVPDGVMAGLLAVQRRLFAVGAAAGCDAATVDEACFAAATASLEAVMRCMDAATDRPAGADGRRSFRFVLPGGTVVAAQAHVCRTVCRRAERRLCAVAPALAPAVLAYVNRLSDYFFLLACHLNHFYGHEETFL